MSSEAEAAGAAITAGLAASAIDGAKARKRPPRGPCVNCGAELSGNYCANCGQPARLHRALLNMVEEFVRGLVLFDTRAWKTLVMLVFRPGTLTHEYIRGRRARYVSPLAMFLLAVFAMFAIFAFTGGSQIGVADQESRVERISERVDNAEEELTEAAELVRELTGSGATGGEIEAAQLKADVARTKVDTLKAAMQATQLTGEPIDAAAIADGEPAEDEGSFYDQIRAASARGDLHVNTGLPAFDREVEQKLANPELAVYKIQNAAYKFAFLLVPISLPLVWLMFMWRRGTTLFDHTVYILYSLSFVSVLFIAFALLSMIPSVLGYLVTPLLLGSLAHAYFHLKGGYGLGWFSAAWRLPFQLTFALIGLSVFLVAIIALGLVG